MGTLRKIAVTGPESTGKSALCEALAKHYGTVWVPEYARGYLQDHSGEYTPKDLDRIAEGQRLAEKRAEKDARGFLFCDTEMTVMKIWSEHAFGYCTEAIARAYRSQHYDLYLLTDVDLPWEPDPLREHPQLRSYFFELYERHLREAGQAFGIVSGTGETRTRRAIELVETLLPKI